MIAKNLMTAKNFKFLRKYFKDKQITLAKMFNVSQSDISAYENGKKQIPMDVLDQIAYRYNVSTEDLGKRDLSLLYDNSPQTIELNNIVDLIKKMFPIRTSSKAKTNNNFKRAYEIVLSSIEANSPDAFYDSIFSLEYAITLFQKAWKESNTYVALSNSISIVLQIYYSYSRQVTTIREDLLKEILKKESINSFDIENFFIRDPNKPIPVNKYEKKRIEIFEKYDDFVYDNIKLLKNNTQFSDLGDYFLAMCYFLGFVEEDFLEYEKCSEVGLYMLIQLIKIENKYAEDFIKSLYQIS